MGVVGSLSLVQNVTLASQPISSMDWSPDKVKTTRRDYWHAAPLIKLLESALSQS